MKKDKFLSVIIVTHNNQQIIKNTLNKLTISLDALNKPWEIIVVDNASSDKTIEVVKENSRRYSRDPDPKASGKKLTLIQSNQNRGYAWANNRGIEKSQGKYILLLNSDVVLNEDSLKKTIDFLDKDPNVGVVTCKILLQNGKIDPACHRGFPTPWVSLTYMIGLEKLFPNIRLFSGYHMWYKDINKTHEIDSCSGAFYLFRREIIEKVGLLDEKFFMYGEDLDFSYRIKNHGYKIIYYPYCFAVHLKYQSGLKSTDRETQKRTIEAFYQAMIIFYQKNYSNKYPFFVTGLIIFMIGLIKNLKLLISRFW
ncbi:glycosyltransferase family 2 protein [Candidatus Gottesmanbacteria bacterium]|nr:glycosyltransferase family 2 protein [Candidatus Gottesmanbacteria bacterium]